MIIDQWRLPDELSPPSSYIERVTVDPPLRPDPPTLLPNKGDIVVSSERWAKKVTLPPRNVLQPIIKHVEQRSNAKFSLIRNSIWYPPEGFMGWHTNSSMPGIRAYITYNEGNGSRFTHLHNKKVHVEYEPIGWIVRMFVIPDYGQPPFWHKIDAGEGNRISIGLLLIGDK